MPYESVEGATNVQMHDKQEETKNESRFRNLHTCAIAGVASLMTMVQSAYMRFRDGRKCVPAGHCASQHRGKVTFDFHAEIKRERDIIANFEGRLSILRCLHSSGGAGLTSLTPSSPPLFRHRFPTRKKNLRASGREYVKRTVAG